MALTVKQLNGDASFLLSFEPIVPDDAVTAHPHQPFHILVDPWLSGATEGVHRPLSTTTQCHSELFPSVHRLPPPDVIIISQNRPDRCNKRTLLKFPKTGTKTIVLAEPSAARRIKSWRHFNPENVIAVTQWEDHHKSGQDTSIRIDVPSSNPGDDPGEITISLIRGHRDVRNQHPAFGITYRPPPSRVRKLNPIGHIPPTTPDSNSKSPVPMNQQHLSPPTIRQVFPLPPTPPASPSLQSTRSTASLTPQYRDRTVSVIYAPHGIKYSVLEAFVTTHLVAEAALPLTALLHPFDDVRSPWWLSRSLNIKGMTFGLETARTTCAKAWISTHDGERITKGIMHHGLRRRTYSVRDVRQALEHSNLSLETARSTQKPTRALALDIGEDVALTSEGIWEEEPDYVVKNPLDKFGEHNWSTSLHFEAPKID